MPVDIVIGAQWGDEGKGRITDLMAAKADVVARYSGGDNAGHTVTIGEAIFKLHLIPSGIIHPGVICLIGNGVVLNPQVLLREMDGLAARGVDVSPARLKISRSAHLITPAHIALDKADEALRGGDAIGTTQRGIGPAYRDKTGRVGLRASLLADPEALADAVHAHVVEKNRVLTQLYGQPALDAAQVAAGFAAYARRLAPHLTDGAQLLDEALRGGQKVLAEGAQGTLLDLDHGTYPFVTSSYPTAGGALVGLGIGPRVIGRIVGVAKAFTSRVGSGPFPSELAGEMALRLRGTGENPWDEYGTTTGRPRRVGWLDIVILRHALRVNSLTELALTKLDILSGLPEIPVCVAYELDGARVTYFPSDLAQLGRARPVYETLPGWEQDITGMRHKRALPANARRYIEFVADMTGTPVSMVSVGPDRQQVIIEA
ncbi:MAG: adenylosuccinate synthase [Ardenticatenaceae bacterium]|nr:adenylosuccinate synthase [Ardenticatenaceae bacterium]